MNEIKVDVAVRSLLLLTCDLRGGSFRRRSSSMDTPWTSAWFYQRMLGQAWPLRRPA